MCSSRSPLLCLIAVVPVIKLGALWDRRVGEMGGLCFLQGSQPQSPENRLLSSLPLSPPSLPPSLTGVGEEEQGAKGTSRALSAQGAEANPRFWRTLRKRHHCKQGAFL